MVSLTDHQSSRFTKLMYIGESGTGKTGSLTSLVKAGFKLRILDMDNGLDVLKTYIKREDPALLANVDYESRRDKFKATNAGVIVDGMPKAFVGAAQLLSKWSDGSTPQNWGPDTFLVVDSLTGLGNAAYEWAKGMNPTAKEPRQWYGAAGEAVENIIAMLTSDDFEANVIIITHVRLIELTDGSLKGIPTSIGTALGNVLPRYFNSLIMAEKAGQGANAARKIKTVPTAFLDLKTPNPFEVAAEVPLSTGLATIVEQLRK